jgi:DNA topoisomerase-1
MEEHGLGTKATRAGIIDTLYKRGYVVGEQMVATKLGLSVTSVLQRYCPDLLEDTFTRELEEMIEHIQTETQTRGGVLLEAVNRLISLLSSLKQHEGDLGEELVDSVEPVRRRGSSLSVPCPRCGSELVIVRSAKTRRRFIGCSAYRAGCGFSLPLPQKGKIQPLTKTCPKCSFQLVQVRYGRRSWVTCPLCYAQRLKGDRSRPVDAVAELDMG